MLQLSGSSLTPWTVARASQLLAALTATLGAAGVPASGNAAVLVSSSSTAGGSRRRLAATGTAATPAAIPSIYAATQTAVVQAVVVAAPNATAALQAALAGAASSGDLAVQLRAQGARRVWWHCALSRSGAVLRGCCLYSCCLQLIAAGGAAT